MADLAVEVGDLGGRDDELVVQTVTAHAAALLRTARRYSLCADDASDAYQRALEIFLTRAGRLRRETVVNWLHQVVKNEALAVREARQRLVASEDVEPDGASVPTPEDRVVSLDRTQRAAEALARLKPQEVQALWLKAQGLSYQEIARRQSWTYTKVNRCLTEGRKAFLERYAGIESGEECRRWAPVVSALVDGEVSARDRREVRAHLRNCAGCRSTVRELRAAGPSLAGVLPVAGAAADGGTVDRVGGLLARVYEAIAGGVHDRIAGSAVKLQAAAEATSTGKMAAVAASAAAIATGGVVSADHAGVLPTRAAAKHEHAQGHAKRPRAGTRVTQRPGAPPAASAAAQPVATHPVTHPTRPRHAVTRRKAPEHEFGFEGGGSPGGGPASGGEPTASAASAGGGGGAGTSSPPPATSSSSPEFGFEGG